MSLDVLVGACLAILFDMRAFLLSNLRNLST